MNGVHDLGGREGFGAVGPAPSEPVFAAAWERRAMGVTFASFAMGLSNGGEFRHSIERMDVAHYVTTRYYEHWLTSVATCLVERAMVTVPQLEQRAGGRFPLSHPVAAFGIAAPPPTSGAFAVGDTVRVRRLTTRGHTRCPGYVMGRIGTVSRADPPASLPDLEAHGEDRRTEATYNVRFEATELWGSGTDAAAIHVDLWASYLERA